jgi:hypothetical protein
LWRYLSTSSARQRSDIQQQLSLCRITDTFLICNC